MSNQEINSVLNSLIEKNRESAETAKQRGLKKLSEGLNKKHKADLSNLFKKYSDKKQKENSSTDTTGTKEKQTTEEKENKEN